MNPGTLITMFFIGICLVIVIGVIWLLFRKHKKIASSLTILFVLAYILFFTLQPIYKRYEHTKRYDTLLTYLTATYPSLKFSIEPRSLQAGDRPFTYIARANDYPYRAEEFRVDNNKNVSHSSYIIDPYTPYEDMDTLITLQATEKPYDYLLQPKSFDNLAAFENEHFLARAVHMDGENLLFIFEKINNQYFLAQVRSVENPKNYIDLTVSPNVYTNYYVLLTLPNFDEQDWQTNRLIDTDIHFTQSPPAIYVTQE